MVRIIIDEAEIPLANKAKQKSVSESKSESEINQKCVMIQPDDYR